MKLMKTEKLMLFTDGSVDPKLNIGFGAYLIIKEESYDLNELKLNVKLKRFINTSSTKLEVQTILWALEDLKDAESKIYVYTDCQNILTLKDRRERFEKNNYASKKNILIKNHELYKAFYILTDKLNCEFIKVKGHKVSNKKDDIDNIFTIVDKASRNALREDVK